MATSKRITFKQQFFKNIIRHFPMHFITELSQPVPPWRFPDEETEAERGKIIFPGPHSLPARQLGSEHTSSELESSLLLPPCVSWTLHVGDSFLSDKMVPRKEGKN
jgi:hypothetical protein